MFGHVVMNEIEFSRLFYRWGNVGISYKSRCIFKTANITDFCKDSGCSNDPDTRNGMKFTVRFFVMGDNFLFQRLYLFI